MLVVFVVAGAASVAVMWYTIVWLKVISYISVNGWNRLGLSKTAEKNGKLSYDDDDNDDSNVCSAMMMIMMMTKTMMMAM